MKSILSVVCLSLLSLQAQANMATLLLQNNLAKAKSPPHCNHIDGEQGNNGVMTPIIDNQLATTVACEFKCKKNKSESVLIKQNFIPSEVGLRTGDNSSENNVYWGSLTAKLRTWSKDSCLKYAISKCDKIEKVEEVNTKSIASGSWSYDLEVNCEGQKEILSPFYSKSGSDTNVIQDQTPLPTTHSFSNIVGELYNYQGKSDPKADRLCKKVIKGDLCFGDCVRFSTKHSVELIQSASIEDIVKDTFEVCADKLIESWRTLHLSPQVKRQLCEKFFWDTIYSKQAGGLSCQSARGFVNCDDL